MTKLMHFIYWSVIIILAMLLWREHQDMPSSSGVTTIEKSAEINSAAREATQTEITSADVESNDSATATWVSADEANGVPPTAAADDGALADNDEQLPSAPEATNNDANEDANARMLAQLQRAQNYPQRLQREGVDQDWNYQVTSDVERVFADVTGLDKEHLGGVTCRMTLCEVLVSARTGSPIDTMMRLQKRLIEMPWYTEDYSTIFDATDSDGFYRIYLERERP
ncbi:hypothetical protein [Pseudidiomarina homiensis]|uniref:Uncharacterized protein n=1 Tax=Pseudidiomarina homiensis TaxID=364198 RepID=A0A432Y321_9GAMM|nr:hypothetical protein [Pseudidiomarina homiensis]RUO55354.1 hypothetical protein CWI70_00775 [Pseudidiomarina homiensis]